MGVACDLSPDGDVIILGTTDVGPFEISSAVIASPGSAFSFIRPAKLTVSFTIANTADTTETLLMALGDSYFGPTLRMASIDFSSSGTFADSGGGAALSFWVDPDNADGGHSSTDLPGIEVGAFSTLTGAGTTPLDAYIQFSMAEGARLTLPGGGAVTGFNMTMDAVPETSTWAMMAIGLATLGVVGYHRAKQPLAA